MIKQCSFATKIILVVALTILLPIFIAFIYIYNIWENTLYDKTNDYLKNTARITISKLEESINYIEDTAFYISASDEIQDFLNDKEGLIHKTPEEIFSKYMVVNDEISSIYIKSRDDDIYSYTKYGYPVFTIDALIEEVASNSSNWNILEDIIFFKQDIVKYLHQDKMGDLVIKINGDKFYEIIKEIDYLNRGVVYLVNENNIIIASKDEEMIGETLSEQYYIQPQTKEQITKEVVIDGVSNTVYTSGNISNGWRLILSLPTSYYKSDIIYMKDNISILMAIIIVFGMTGIIIVSKEITKPLKLLANEMEQIGCEEVYKKSNSFKGDEIYSLNNSFRRMLERVTMLTESQYRQKINMQEAELRSLQMQINPHFLYNTLDTINWMARMKGNNDIGDITSSLGKLMRYSLSKNDFVLINQEIQSLVSYMEIQKVRYRDRIEVDFKVEENIGNYYIPKLLIQPILENAIIHGAENKIDTCKVNVEVLSAGDDIDIIIKDTGIGIDEDTLEKISRGDMTTKKDHTSVGLVNVKNRIKLIFGEPYGLQIESKIGEGTKIILHIGKMESC